MTPSTSLLDPQDTFSTLAASIGLDYRLRKSIARLGYIRPTLVQSKCLPLAIKSGRDLLVRARTGSGKTLAYCIPILQTILSGKNSSEETFSDVKAIVLVPTKELCTQVSKVLNSLIYYCDDEVSIATLFSEKNSSQASVVQQQALLRDRPDILVSTPAGLLSHIKRDSSNLIHSLQNSVECLVVDEADIVLSFGYTDDITEITKYLPRVYQGFLMSATLSPELNYLKKVMLHTPAVLKLEEDLDAYSNGKDLVNLSQIYLALPKHDKYLVIYVFLKLGLLKGKGLFFVNATTAGYRLKLFLEQFHIRSAVLNAELPLRSRLNIIEQYNVGNFDYLIATDGSTDSPSTDNEKDLDVKRIRKDHKPAKKRNIDSEYSIARGLDFRGVSFVVNVDFPDSPESYTHRIGRTARGRAKGVAFSLVDADSQPELKMLSVIQESQPSLPAKDSILSNSFLHTQGSTTNGIEGHQTSGSISQPSALDFDLKEIEGFRYRVDDVKRAVTKIAIQETRAKELNAEILNSVRLQNHFIDNPNELQLLRHDRQSTHVSKVQIHLRNVPTYLLPRGMHVPETRKKRKKKRVFKNDASRRTDNDPLLCYDGEDVHLNGLEDGEGQSGTDMFEVPGSKSRGSEVDGAQDDSQTSTSGRREWQKRHGRGRYSNKQQKKKRFRDF